MGKLSTAVSLEHKRILGLQRCDRTTREVLQVLPEMLKIDPDDRWTAENARDQFKRILRRAEMAMASPHRDSQSGEASARQATTPSRSTTISSDTSSLLSPHVNSQLSTTTEETRQDTSAGASPKFGKILVHTPRTMTMKSDMDVNDVGSFDIASGSLGTPLQQAIQSESPNRVAHGTTVHSQVLPDRTRQINGVRESNPGKQPPALMSPFQDAGQSSLNQPQSQQLDTSHRNPNKQSTPDPPAAATAEHAGPEDLTQPVQDPEPKAASGPSIPLTPPARLSFRDALKWRMNAKAQRSASQLSNHHLLQYLESRDHVSSGTSIIPRTTEHADRICRYLWSTMARLCAIFVTSTGNKARVRSPIMSMF
jgi:hypothetical protein